MRRQENQKYTEAISYQTVGAARIDPHNLAKYFQSGEIRSKAANLSGFSENRAVRSSCARHCPNKV